ncbi:DUF4327 family protein [Pseudanabaena sp. PCC 6802]|uniref:DUF4327 family protein n=1 Tax=Pseudanabaena sp. PCC 6802 TaxID=118173 RepID=UPI00034630F7|nr:DUF4327 family protein [Pseudanabaena sp. PCC 6802]
MLPTLHYSIDAIRDEARHLVETGSLTRQQPIHSLCRFIPDRQWSDVEHELEVNQFLLRDRIADLFSQEDWSND